MTTSELSLFIPVLIGIGRRGRLSEPVAKWIFAELLKREDVESELLDVRTINVQIEQPVDELKDSVFASKMARADALILVVPEYNHGYPGLLKHVLDLNLEEYIHKAVGICGVSAGPFGGARAIENLLPVLRELGLTAISADVNFGQAGKLFADDGRLLEPAYLRRVGTFLDELFGMARALRAARGHKSA